MKTKHGNGNQPPRLADWIVRKFLDTGLLEELLGDLHELHEERVVQRGRVLASLLYWIDAAHLLIGFSTVKIFSKSNSTMMIKSIFKIAFRNALKQKQFTLLNVGGLTLGIAAALIIGLYVFDEMTYDRFHTKGDRIYRINQPMIWNNWDEQFSSTGPNVADALRTDAPEFEEVTRLLSSGEQTIRVNADTRDAVIFSEKSCFAADDNFFRIFSFPFLSGDSSTALVEPMSMVITRKTALRYFGKVDAIGKSVEIKEKDGSWSAYMVRGILDDIPTRSHLQFDALVSMTSYSEAMKRDGWKWIWTAFSTYGLVREGTDIASLSEKIQVIPPKWAAPTTERIFNQTFADFTAGKQWRLYLQPLREIYLSSSPKTHRFGPTGNPIMMNVFLVIGTLVLVLCSINFMNLSTARSAGRAKEVGVRKALGSARNGLIWQFIIESTLFVGISTAIAFTIVQPSLSAFNILSEKQLSLLPYIIDPVFIGVVFIFILVLGVAAGSYPAYYLSSFKPLETIKGKVRSGFKRTHVRNVLVVFQFTVSVTLVILTLIVHKQLTFSATMDVGFQKANILQLHNVEQLGARAEVLQNRLAGHPLFTDVAKSFGVPPYVWEGERYKAFGNESAVLDINNFRVDENYLDMLNVEFIAGRNFDKNRIGDKYAVILNEEAVKALGWGTKDTFAKNSPVGKFVVQAFDNAEKLEVIGVVKDFNYNSVRHKIDPLMILHNQNDKFWNYGQGRSYISVRINPMVVKTSDDLQEAVKSLKTELSNIDASIQFEYSFMDQEFDSTFRAERKMAIILELFTGLAIMIACLGLFGLAAFAAEQRKKELGIRKVHGAKVRQLIFLFSSEFTTLVLAAILIASPIAYVLGRIWLSDFANRTQIDAWSFILAGIGALLIAVTTISLQAVAAARVNPVDTLRGE